MFSKKTKTKNLNILAKTHDREISNKVDWDKPSQVASNFLINLKSFNNKHKHMIKSWRDQSYKYNEHKNSYQLETKCAEF